MRVRLITGVLFLASLTVYLSTACRDTYWFDSPEFTTTAKNLDISHPPGYPLWNFLSHLATLVPVGNVDFRVAAFSSVCCALAVALFFRFMLSMGACLPAAVSAACTLAFLKQFWSLGVVAEVYGLEIVLLIGLLLSLRPWHKGPAMPCMPLSAFLAGCLVAHRPSDILFLPFLLGLAPLSMQLVPKATLWFSVAWTPYLYTWWHLTNRFSMGYFDYPKDLTTFYWIVTGKHYAENLFSLSLHDSLVELKNYLMLVVGDFGPLMLTFALVGLVTAYRRRSPELLTILGISMVNVLFCTNYNVIETNTMVLPSLVMVCWLVAIGVSTVLHFLNERGQTGIARTVIVLALALPLAQIPLNYGACDRSDYHEVSRYLRNLYEMVPQGGHSVVTTDVDALPVLYGRFCLGRRLDLGYTAVDEWLPDISKSMNEFLDRGDELYGPLFLVREEFDRARADFRLRRRGFLYRIEKRDAGPDEEEPVSQGRRFEEGVVFGGLQVPGPLITSPGLARIGMRWGIEARPEMVWPGVVLALYKPGAGTEDLPVATAIQPIGGLTEPAGRGTWLDDYWFRLPEDTPPGDYELRIGVLDLCPVTDSGVSNCSVTSSSRVTGASDAIECFDPAAIEGLDFWKERQMQYIEAIRLAVPYHTPSWRVRDWRRLLKSNLLIPHEEGPRLLPLGPIRVAAPPPDRRLSEKAPAPR